MLEAVNAGSEIAAGFCNLGVEKGGGVQPEAGGGGDGKSYLHFHQLASLPTPFRKGDGCNGCNFINHWGDGVLGRGSRAAIAGEGG